MISTVLAQTFNFLSGVVCARILGKQGFGEFGILQSTVAAFGVFAGMGLGLTTVKYVAELRECNPERAGSIIGSTGLIAAIGGISATICIWILAPTLAQRTLHSSALAPDLRIASMLVLFNAVAGTQAGALGGLEAFRSIAALNLISGSITFPMMIACAYFGGIGGVAWGLVGTSMIACVGGNVILRHRLRRVGITINFRRVRQEGNVFWQFSLPAFLSDIVLAPVSWLASAILVRSPHGLEQMGIFSAANQWRSALVFIPAVLGQVLIPMTSSLREQKDYRRIRASVKLAVLTNAAWALPVVAVLFVFGNQLMRLYGAAFEQHGTVIRLTGATGALIAIQAPASNLIAGYGRMWTGAVQNAAWALVLLVSSYYLIHVGLGAKGLALAYLTAYAAHSVWTIWFGLRLVSASVDTSAQRSDCD